MSTDTRLDPVDTTVGGLAFASPPTGRESRTGRRALPRGSALRRGLALALGLVLLCGIGAALWPRQPSAVAALGSGLQLARNAPPLGPVGIEQVRVPLLWTGPGTPATTITVSNSTATPHAVRVWWILARYGDVAPWRDPLAESAHTAARVAGHATTAVSIPAASGALLPATGVYVLTLWAHTVLPDGADTHSDGVALSSPIAVQPVASNLREAVLDASAPLRVVAVSPVRNGSRLSVDVALGNLSAEEASVQLDLTATNGAGVSVHSSPLALVLDPGPVAKVRVPLVLPAGWSGAVQLTTVVSTLLPDGLAAPAAAAALAHPLELGTARR